MMKTPFQIKKVKETDNFGIFTFEPLERGYGDTLGNSLRRVLLNSIPGAALVQTKINGIKHRFSALEGLEEDTIELILNLKQVRLRYAGSKPVTVQLEKSGPGPVTAGDIGTPASVKIANPDLVLANLATKNNRLKMEMVVEAGSGWISADERQADKLGVIPLDASFSPVTRVNYHIESTRVGRQTDFERLILEISTDGTIKPGETLKQAGQILVNLFQQVVEPKKVNRVKEKIIEVSSEVLKLTVEEIDLPTRIANALRKGGFGTVEDLVKANTIDLTRVKNLGEKSIKAVAQALSKRKVSLKEN